MFPHDPVIVPRLKQCNLDMGRVYQIQTGPHAGNVYPSITRVLAAKPKPQLEAWRARVGHTEATKITARAATRGSGLHKLGECFLGNRELPDITPSVGELWQYLHPWLSSHVTMVRGQEVDVYSHRLQVAGRMDLLAQVDGVLAVVDFKQANQPKKTEYLTDYWLQTTFYACAIYELTGVKVKKLILPITSPAGLQVFECKPTEHLDELVSRIDEFYQTYTA